jgi:hypothetical protein
MAYPELLRKPNPAVRELQHTDFEAVEQENERLRELVVQLSKLVVKYVIAGTSAVDSGRPAAIQAPLGREVAKMDDPEVPTSIPLGVNEAIK